LFFKLFNIHRNYEFEIKVLFFSILFTLQESGCSYEQQDTPTSFVAKDSHVDGCCFAAAYGIRPWSPWIWGMLNFRSIRVILYLLLE